MARLEAIETATTPAALQPLATLARRRLFVLAANLGLYVALCLWLSRILGADGWGALDVVFMLCFMVASPWSVIGFVNAALGLWLQRFSVEGLAKTAPFLAAADIEAQILERTAVVMTVRNEDPARAVARFSAMEAVVSATPDAARFSWHLLSDTSEPALAQEEERLIAQWRAARPDSAARIHYRRRVENTGFKAGNLAEFCAHARDDYDCALVLDADSFMRAETIVAMARIMQAHPQIGVLQSLVVGARSQSAFARLFQFGMRAGMRSYTLGATWWTGDCGPFWGHNAFLRIRPFVDHCKLPELPGGPILSHDQVEAALMRRAGYEVRVMPVESGSFEENPPDMVEFSRRDVRWCRGNMQYWRLLGLPGLLPLSRFQLAWAIAMFVGLPAGQLMLFIAALKPFATAGAFPAGSAIAFLCVYLLVGLAPKLAGFADVLLGRETARYGGPGKFAAGAALELAASFLLSAPVGFQTALFLAGLPFGGKLAWGAQRRDAGALSWRDAAHAFWPATLFGWFVLVLLATGAPAAIPFALPFVGGLAVAVPFAKVTASPALGAYFVRKKICATPEELAATLSAP
ncbi:MAG: glucans biosynthesis glucosyltransferase MdoH [Hyphomicrobiales bacterium]|nr:glucans biosynthesis glucosyltransferase MdoH [Hyphomicrobiales bacterium]